MAKTLLYRLFGTGKISQDTMRELEHEGLLLWEEGIPGSVSYINFRGPGKFFALKRKWHTCAIAATETRLLVLRNGSPLINVPYTDPRYSRMRFSVERGDRLVIAFDAALFHDGNSGTIEYRFFTPEAANFFRLLSSRKGSDGVSLDAVPPVVVSTIPEAGATGVDPRLREIRITFSKVMYDSGFSLSTHSEDSFPEIAGEPKYSSDQRTCVLPVRLESDRTYALWVNSQNHRNFKDTFGQSALPYLLVFQTRG
jgi:RNA polymerase sigma-70 factor (ECF subfamily)